MVHSQRAPFFLAHLPVEKDEAAPFSLRIEPSAGHFSIRNGAGRLLGRIFLADSAAQRFELSGCTAATSLRFRHQTSFRVSRQYPQRAFKILIIVFALGPSALRLLIPLRYQNGGLTQEVSETAIYLRHIPECAFHPRLDKPLPYQPDFEQEYECLKRDDLNNSGSVRPDCERRSRAIMKHFAEVSYFDVEGRLLHDWDEVPALRVMMIMPSIGKGRVTQVYQRLRLGTIYLKRWVEAEPKFETVGLE
jgi:hypothetical protein